MVDAICPKCSGRGRRNCWSELGFFELFWKPHRILCEVCDGDGYVNQADARPEDPLDEYNRIWGMFHEIQLQATQYTETIGLDQPIEYYCWVADTYSGDVETLLKYNCLQDVLRHGWDSVFEPPQHFSNNRCCEDPAHGGIPVPDDIAEELIKYGEAGRRGVAAGEALKNAMRRITDEQGKRVWESMPADKSAVFTAADLKADRVSNPKEHLSNPVFPVR